MNNLIITANSGITLAMRAIAPADISAIMSIERSVHSHPWRQSSFEECLKGRQQCWLAEYGCELVGYVVVTHGGGDAELLNVSVASPYQRRGIGSCLVQHAINSVKGKADMLFLEVRMSNQKAIELYSKEGFFEVGQRKNYYPTTKGHEDALLMAAQLK